MPLSRGHNRIIHVAKKQLGLDDDAYRTILIRLADVDTSGDLTPAKFDAVMGYFEYLGFEPLRTTGPYYGKRENTDMASPLQIQLIRDLWAKFSGATDWAALDNWLHKYHKVSSLRFADKTIAGKAIHALRKMAGRKADARRRTSR